MNHVATNPSAVTEKLAINEQTAESQSDIAAIMSTEPTEKKTTQGLSSFWAEGMSELKLFFAGNETNSTTTLQTKAQNESDTIGEAISGSPARSESLKPSQISFDMEEQEKNIITKRKH